MGIVNPFKTEQDKTHKAARDAVQLGLTNTNPILIQPGAEVEVNGYAIQALANTQFITLHTNLDNDSNVDPLISGDAITLPAGHVIYVRVKKIELNSGLVIIYQL